MQCFKNCNITSHSCKLTCTGQTCRTRTYDCDLVSVCRSRILLTIMEFCSCICYKTLQLTDGNSLAFDSADTFSFTLVLLRAYTSTSSRKRCIPRKNFVSLLNLSNFYSADKCRNINRNRTAFDTFCIFTSKASLCFHHCFFFIISITNFFEIRCSYLWILLSYRNFF